MTEVLLVVVCFRQTEKQRKANETTITPSRARICLLAMNSTAFKRHVLFCCSIFSSSLDSHSEKSVSCFYVREDRAIDWFVVLKKPDPEPEA